MIVQTKSSWYIFNMIDFFQIFVPQSTGIVI